MQIPLNRFDDASQDDLVVLYFDLNIASFVKTSSKPSMTIVSSSSFVGLHFTSAGSMLFSKPEGIVTFSGVKNVLLLYRVPIVAYSNFL